MKSPRSLALVDKTKSADRWDCGPCGEDQNQHQHQYQQGQAHSQGGDALDHLMNANEHHNLHQQLMQIESEVQQYNDQQQQFDQYTNDLQRQQQQQSGSSPPPWALCSEQRRGSLITDQLLAYLKHLEPSEAERQLAQLANSEMYDNRGYKLHHVVNVVLPKDPIDNLFLQSDFIVLDVRAK